MGDDEKLLEEELDGVSSDGITVSEEQIEKLNDQYEAIKQGIEGSYTEQTTAVDRAYGTQETALGKLVEEAETLRGQKKEQDEQARRRENAYRYIAGIGDAISGVANLVGTAKGAASQTQYYNAPAVIQKAEASRKERKLEMDKLKERLDELSAQKTAIQSTRELKSGELAGKKAAELAAAELQRVKGMGEIATANAKNVTELTRTAMNNAASIQKAGRSGGSSGQPQTQHQFDFGNGDGAVIPKHKWTKAAMAEVYSLIPEEERTRRVRKNQYGLDEKDADGNPVYYTPSEAEMTADIVAAAKKHPEVQAKLKALEKGRIFDTL